VALLARSLRAGIKQLQDFMISSILKGTTYLLSPLKEFIPDRGHEAMALLLDPRFCHGNFILDTALSAADDMERKRAAKALMRTCNDHVLKPALTQLAKFMRQEEQHSSGKGALNAVSGGPCVMKTVMMTTVMKKEKGIRMIHYLFRAVKRS